VTDKTDIKNYP